jgi:hypothetical protein
MNLTQYGGRRFLLTVGCGGVCSILLWFGKLSDPSFTTIILGTVAVYIAANTTQKVKGPQPGEQQS